MIYLSFFGSLLVTIIVEGAAVLFIFRRKGFVDTKKVVYTSVYCNLLTNPALNLLLLVFVHQFGEGAYIPALILLELAAVFVEAAVYQYLCRFGMLLSVLLSAFLNVLSFASGFVVNIITVLLLS